MIRVAAPLIRLRLWRFINLLTYLLTYLQAKYMMQSESQHVVNAKHQCEQ